ncbi:hypothetical protein ABL78_5390 [Leptomonas seymouri]|uniref:Leucine-rich repeat protein n=1 Tax=Leptomonas seymouri TaxID=5684 RepID=A0A0N1PCI9_LEPSE|nr:hypothetical protein ABL78_5390 [Leptomonas seymouri]|eukprot:KPI85541.1 hypothetical protein ABL78_5390 [Leptomonas seymouri]
MTAEVNSTVPNPSLENSLNRRRNTHATLPGLAASRPLSPVILDSSNFPRYTNTSRRNTVSRADCSTPPSSTANSMAKDAVATHAASEPRLHTIGRLSLNPSAVSGRPPTLPPVADRCEAPSKPVANNDARYSTAGVARTNGAIVRSTRLPLCTGISPSSSNASTPQACQTSVNWTAAPHLPAPGSAATSASPAPTAHSSSFSKMELTAENIKLVSDMAAHRVGSNGSAALPAGGSSTTSVATTATATGRKTPPPPEHERKKLNNAIKTFNQRVKEEMEKERARSSRSSNCAISRENSMSAIAVPSTQPPSAGPQHLLPLSNSPPPHNFPVSSEKANPTLKVNASSSSSSSANTSPRTSGVLHLPRNTRHITKSRQPGTTKRPLVEPRQPLGSPSTAPTPSQPSDGTLSVPLNITPGASSSPPAALVRSNSSRQEAPSSAVHPGSGLANSASATAGSLPSRYSDFNDEASRTPPAQPLAIPVYSAVEVQAFTPPASISTSPRRGLPGFAAILGDLKKDGAAANAKGKVDVATAVPEKKASGNAGSHNNTSGSSSSTSSKSLQRTPPAQGAASESGAVKRNTPVGLDDAREGAATSNVGSANGKGSAAAQQRKAESTTSADFSLSSSGGSSPRKQASSAQTSPLQGSAKNRLATTSESAPATRLILTALPIFNPTGESKPSRDGSPDQPSARGPGTPAAVAKATPLPRRAPQPRAAKPTATHSTTTPPTPTTSTATKETGPAATTDNKQKRNSVPTASAALSSNFANPSSASQQRPGSALTLNGRYAANRGRGSHRQQGSEKDSYSPLNAEDCATGADVSAETATLNTYLKEEELNLSLSTFNNVGMALAHSLNLRVLNLKGSTISSEGLRGLANISTLKSICVSHMRGLTTLEPLVTPTAAGVRCAIEEIDAQFSSIGNDGIKELEKVHCLRCLDLSMTPISDVTSLAHCVSLKELYLTGTRVDNAGVAGLERLPALTTLNIARTKVTSLCQLAKSRSLQTFILYNCHVNDAGFVGVGEMPQLSTLDISTTKIENLSALQKSRSLNSVKAQWLSLKNCQDIIQERRSQVDGPPPGDSAEWRDTEAGFSSLAAIPTLETLDLSFNTLRSIHSLCRSKSIKHLYLKRTRMGNGGIGSIAQIAPTLETLVITNLSDSLDNDDDEHEFDGSTSGLLSSIGDIHMLRHLTLLDLSYTDVFDLRMLQNISTLKELIIVETLVTVDGLRGIEKIPSLELLDISQTSILSLQFLVRGALALKKIFARSNRNASGIALDQVHKLPALEHLDLSDSVVGDMERVPKGCWRLKELVWRWGERRDSKGLAPPLECAVTSPRLAGLCDMPCLSFLDLTGSHVHELSFLKNAPCLKTLHLKLCKLLRNCTIQELGSLAALEVLQLSDNPQLTDVTCLRSCRKLRELQLSNTRVNTKGLNDVVNLPELKVLNIVNTRAEDEAMINGNAKERNRVLEDSNVRDGSVVLEKTVTPVQFRLPRRRHVSFIAHEGSDSASHTS